MEPGKQCILVVMPPLHHGVVGRNVKMDVIWLGVFFIGEEVDHGVVVDRRDTDPDLVASLNVRCHQHHEASKFDTVCDGHAEVHHETNGLLLRAIEERPEDVDVL
ncbi:hypothetical protein B0H10DRAFT_2041694, partial [Mycena sp. CBHHK59/15]